MAFDVLCNNFFFFLNLMMCLFLLVDEHFLIKIYEESTVLFVLFCSP